MHNCAPILIFIFVLKYFWDWDGGKRNLNLNEMGLRSSSIFQLTYTLIHSTQFCIADTQKNDSRDDDDVILLFKSRSEWASEIHLTIGYMLCKREDLFIEFGFLFQKIIYENVNSVY